MFGLNKRKDVPDGKVLKKLFVKISVQFCPSFEHF
jgi:hypothetical protein